MYAPFFGLKQEPFSIAPDPRYLFMSERHREALAHLLYGVGGGGGFVLLTGEIGAGKTTVCRCFLEQIPRRCNVAYIFNPKLTVEELLKSVCDEFRIPQPALAGRSPTVKDYVDRLNEFLLKTHAVGQNNVLIIDEAQNLSADVLEQLRLLTNLETNERKLLQIILIGQPELRSMLARPELEQLAQRVIARYHLKALSEGETVQYIRHRLLVAGLTTALPFDRAALQRVHELSRGVPRRINLLCDRALLGGYAHGRTQVDAAMVDKAAGEVFDEPGPARPDARPADAARPARAVALAGGLGLLAGAALFALWGLGREGAAPSGKAFAQPPASAASAARGLASAGPASGTTPARAASGASAASAAGTARPRAGGATGTAEDDAGPATPQAAGPAAAALADLANPGGTANHATPGADAGEAPADAAGRPLLRDEREAWRELAAAWKLDLGGAAEPCAAAERHELRCFRASGSLAQIRQLDRPVILALHPTDGDQTVYAQLTGLAGGGATLRVGGTAQTVALPTLARLWRGEWATLWRAPPGYADRALDGTGGGAATDWLRATLARVDGQPAPADGEPGARAAALRARVSAFQLAQGLTPDGLAGPVTLMHLNRAAGIDEPRLALDTPRER